MLAGFSLSQKNKKQANNSFLNKFILFSIYKIIQKAIISTSKQTTPLDRDPKTVATARNAKAKNQSRYPLRRMEDWVGSLKPTGTCSFTIGITHKPNTGRIVYAWGCGKHDFIA